MSDTVRVIAYLFGGTKWVPVTIDRYEGDNVLVRFGFNGNTVAVVSRDRVFVERLHH